MYHILGEIIGDMHQIYKLIEVLKVARWAALFYGGNNEREAV